MINLNFIGNIGKDAEQTSKPNWTNDVVNFSVCAQPNRRFDATGRIPDKAGKGDVPPSRHLNTPATQELLKKEDSNPKTLKFLQMQLRLVIRRI